MDTVQIFIHPAYKYKYLYNEAHKTAVLLKVITKIKAEQFKNKLNKRFQNPHDISKLGTSISMAKLAISYFLNRPQFEGFAIATSIGTKTHECCVFFQRSSDHLNAVFFNPNFSRIQQGTQSNKLFTSLVESFGNQIRNIHAYHSPCGNITGRCSAFVWEQIFRLIHDGISPFNTNMRLESYIHCMTQSAYNAIHYKKKNKTERYDENYKRQFNHFLMWRGLDELVEDLDDTNTLKISRIIGHKINLFLFME